MNTKPLMPYVVAGATGALMATLAPLLLTSTQADTKLLPFQGRLTDAAGTAIADGAKVVEFKMYDAPTGGNVKWAGEVHKLSVNGGLVNTMLGSKATLGSVDFSTPTYLQITIDAQATGQAGSGVIDAADPPLLPRQSVVPAVYAVESGNSRKLNNADWSAILTNGSNDPATGSLRGDKLAAGSVNTRTWRILRAAAQYWRFLLRRENRFVSGPGRTGAIRAAGLQFGAGGFLRKRHAEHHYSGGSISVIGWIYDIYDRATTCFKNRGPGAGSHSGNPAGSLAG